ncbi:putative tRNA pseudouridine synthase 4 [Golovinomyces cichoracearum]|uniref:tRNA pseudouridine(55) synthase n=1 Tax=Golovinomyces cichoracearum TaxID=62708 RepID=A0A420J5W5_9PEZI|nr:putative tRNA pseudouridine synthase 4 [Golovinomyces cichoracearum]
MREVNSVFIYKNSYYSPMLVKYIGKNYWTMTAGKIVEGVFAVNKPSGISSAQVLRDLQKHFNPSNLFAPWLENERSIRGRELPNQRRRRRMKDIQVKIGHGGTLDPLATGILITGVGRGTKSLQDFLMCTKDYEAIVLFGTGTDTYDRVGKVLKRAPYEHITKELVEKALENFRGKFMQLPPLFSALKMNGKPLYQYARTGEEIPREIKKRPTEVLRLELVEWMEGGTHPHMPPTDEGGYAEVNVANKFWTQVETQREVEGSETRSEGLETITGNDKSVANSDATLPNQKIDIKPEINNDGEIKSPKSGQKIKLEQQDSDSELYNSKKRKRSTSQENSASKELIFSESPKIAPFNSGDAPISGDLLTSSDVAVKSEITDNCAPKIPNQSKSPPAVRLRMTVTSGFYVRSLCHDLGLAVGSVALMAELSRTRQGEYDIEKGNALEYFDLEKGESVWGPKVKTWLEEWEVKNPVRTIN